MKPALSLPCHNSYRGQLSSRCPQRRCRHRLPVALSGGTVRGACCAGPTAAWHHRPWSSLAWLVSVRQAAEPRCATSAPELNAPLSFPFRTGPLMSIVSSLYTEGANTLTALLPIPTVANTLVICACQCPSPVTLGSKQTHTHKRQSAF